MDCVTLASKKFHFSRGTSIRSHHVSRLILDFFFSISEYFSCSRSAWCSFYPSTSYRMCSKNGRLRRSLLLSIQKVRLSKMCHSQPLPSATWIRRAGRWWKISPITPHWRRTWIMCAIWTRTLPSRYQSMAQIVGPVSESSSSMCHNRVQKCCWTADSGQKNGHACNYSIQYWRTKAFVVCLMRSIRNICIGILGKRDQISGNSIHQYKILHSSVE